METVWKITLFGGLRAIPASGGEAITRFRTRRAAALLAALAFRIGETPPTRDELIELLWPYAEPEAALARLAVELSALRRQLEPSGVSRGSILRADRFTISLDPTAVTTDVSAFEQSLRRVKTSESTAERLGTLADAIASYAGPLLPQIDGDWIEPERERLGTLFVASATDAVSLFLQRGETEAALDASRAALQRERMREAMHCLVLRAEIAAGRPTDALKTFESLRRMLQESVGDTPSAEARRFEAEARQRIRTPVVAPMAESAASDVPAPTAARAAPLPLGTLAILATDIEGSTTLGRSIGEERFAQVLERHHALMRTEFARAGGIEFNESGDGFSVAFEAAGDALRCACACQRALAEARSGAGASESVEGLPNIRVRMALHVGDLVFTDAGSAAAAATMGDATAHSQPAIGLRGTGSYRGLVLHDLARLLSAASGGQIYLSEAAAAVLRRSLPAGVTVIDRGRYRLRDAPGPEIIFQAFWDAATDAEKSPAPNAPKAVVPIGLPSSFTRFFGRDAELSALLEMLVDNADARLVTLTGLGGSGKTRLATEAARLAANRLGGAVWFVDLVRIDDAARIGDAIRSIVAPDVTGELFDALAPVFESESGLLVLDNLEHLLTSDEACEFLQRLLMRFPKLKCLATSRQRIGVAFEQELALQPLPIPGVDAAARGVSTALGFASVALFEDRAKRVRFDFQVTERNAAAVARLCAHLEGIPLAIELAAAWARLLSPAEMLTQFDDIRRTRDRDMPMRHRSLDAAIEGSYRLLDDEQRTFFRRLSVFHGGWTLEAAKAVCDEPMALALLGELRDRSLVVAEESGETTRYRFLETVREFAAARLAENTEESEERFRRLIEFYAALAAEANDALQGPDQAAWLTRLAAEHLNIATVVDRAERLRRLQMVSQLHRYFMVRGYLPEARGFLDDVLNGDNQSVPDSDLNKAITVAGVLALTACDFSAAQRLFEAARARCRVLGDERGAGAATINLGIVARSQGDFTTAREAYESTINLWRKLDRRKTLAIVLGNLGNVAKEQGDLEGAQRFLKESLDLQDADSDVMLRADTLQNLAFVADAQNDLPAATWFAAESLRLRITLADRRGISRLLPEIASIQFSLGNSVDAARLYGAAEAALSVAGASWTPTMCREIEEKLAALKSLIGTDRAQQAWKEGRELHWEGIVEAALDATRK